MKSKLVIFAIIFIALTGCTGTPKAVKETDIDFFWEVSDGILSPESVVYDPSREIIYISNGALNRDKGKAYISRHLINGDLIDKICVGELDNPGGLALFRDKLYVADKSKLKVIDLESNLIIESYDTSGDQNLNDVAVSLDGTIFVTSWLANRIYRLKDNDFSIWLEDPQLETPNGLSVEDNRLIIASWGPDPNPVDFSTSRPGQLLEVSLETKSVSVLSGPLGNLDGLEVVNKSGYLLTDWVAGQLIFANYLGEKTILIDNLNSGCADLTYIEAEGLVLIPQMVENKIICFKVNSTN